MANRKVLDLKKHVIITWGNVGTLWGILEYLPLEEFEKRVCTRGELVLRIILQQTPQTNKGVRKSYSVTWYGLLSLKAFYFFILQQDTSKAYISCASVEIIPTNAQISFI